MSFNVIGKSIPRHDAELQVTGQSIYGDDVVRPNMLHCLVLRSKHPHAKILSIDTSKAEQLEGVKGIVTSKDVPFNAFGFTHIDQPILAEDKVRYIGDAVAAVAAETLEIAEEALDLIEVDYEVLPGVFDSLEAMKEDSPKVHGDSNIATYLQIKDGDIEQGWKESDMIIEEDFTTPRVEHAAIEPHVAIAEVDMSGELVVWATVQRPFTIASDLNKVLKIPMNKIRVIATDIGGGFGGKNETSIEPFVAMLTMKTGRPVKLVYSREDEFISSTIRHPYRINMKTGVKNDGTIVAREVKIISDGGAYASWGESTLNKASIHACGPYIIPNVNVEGYLIYTNNPVGGAMRGFGVPQLGFAYEAHTDTVAERLNMDPIEFRLKNVMVDGSAMPTGQAIEKVTIKETIEMALKLAGPKEVL
ncbi:MAG TPA: molybdopterin-dependent oxidoreductase [Clostridiales bacterium]|nr:molybdopterin-dependent oxidoreductase [Clostridiales bacterium]